MTYSRLERLLPLLPQMRCQIVRGGVPAGSPAVTVEFDSVPAKLGPLAASPLDAALPLAASPFAMELLSLPP